MSRPTLDRLLTPTRISGWLSDHHEQRHLHLSGDTQRTAGLPTIDDIDALLAYAQLRHPDDIRLVDHAAGGMITADRWTYPSGLVDVPAAMRAYRGGATLVLPQAQWRFPAFAHLVRDVERLLGARSQANLYLTPPDAQGLSPHHDTHAVLAIQLAGAKRWRLYDSPTVLPLADMAHPSGEDPGPVRTELTTVAGDVLYLPRGQVHDAACVGDEPSLHATLGVVSITWADVYASALAAAAHADPALRGSVPAGWVTGDVTTRPPLDLMPHVDAGLAALRAEFVTGRNTLSPGALTRALDAEPTHVRVVADAIWSLEADEADAAGGQLLSSGSRTYLDASEVAVARTALSGATVAVADLDEASHAVVTMLRTHGLVAGVQPVES